MSNKFVLTMAGIASLVAFATVFYIKSVNDKLSDCLSRNTLLVSSLNSQNEAIETWKYESQIAQKKIDESSQAANNKFEQIKQKEKTIMDEDVPKECNSAIRWSIQQAKEMRP